jgi:hypothetical protein
VSTEARARTWLRLDGAYCAGGGVLALVLARPLGELAHAPAEVFAAVGVGAIAWALVLTWLARQPEWRQPLRLVAAANVAASAAIAVVAFVTPALAARLLFAAVALEVAAFAAVQWRLQR